MNIRKNNALIIIFFLFIMTLLPVFTHGAVGNKGDTGITYDCAAENAGRAQGECTFSDLIIAVKKVVDWGTLFAIEFSVVVIAWAGFNYMISGENASKRREANEMLRKVAFGIAFILAAWLIVTLIAKGLGVKVPIFLG